MCDSSSSLHTFGVAEKPSSARANSCALLCHISPLGSERRAGQEATSATASSTPSRADDADGCRGRSDEREAGRTDSGRRRRERRSVAGSPEIGSRIVHWLSRCEFSARLLRRFCAMLDRRQDLATERRHRSRACRWLSDEGTALLLDNGPQQAPRRLRVTCVCTISSRAHRSSNANGLVKWRRCRSEALIMVNARRTSKR